MRTIPLREFMLHGSSLLDELPLSLTVRGVAVCMVLPATKYTVTDIGEGATIPADDRVSTVVSTQPMKTITFHRCHFCGAPGATLHKYQFTDGSGEAEAMFCNFCWQKYQEGCVVKSDISQVYVRRPVNAGLVPFHGSFPKPVSKKKAR